jgi:hypothetical protein
MGLALHIASRVTVIFLRRGRAVRQGGDGCLSGGKWVIH